MNDKKIANCMQFAIKRNIMKKKEEAISMARTANVFARVEPEVKEQAEYIQQVKLRSRNETGIWYMKYKVMYTAGAKRGLSG